MWFIPVLCYMGRERYDYELLGWVARRLKELREEKGLSQEKVYFDTGLNVGRIELGKTNISLTTLSVLSKYYNIKLEDFFRQKGINKLHQLEKVNKLFCEINFLY